MAAAEVCPVVGTTNHTLPPHHPDIDKVDESQTCPIVGASKKHHLNVLHQHIPIPRDEESKGVGACPGLSQKLKEPKSKEMDDDVCPVVGTATTVLSVGHPSLDGIDSEDECPVTKAKVKHHKERVVAHPDVKSAAPGAVCPVVGKEGMGKYAH